MLFGAGQVVVDSLPDDSSCAAERLRIPINDSIIVGDSVWDLLAARRAKTLVVVCFAAATDRRNWKMPALNGSTKIPPTCCIIWASWEFVRQDQPTALVPNKISGTHQVWGTIMAAPCGAAAALFRWYK